MDVTPLSAKIEENARKITEGLLSEARARVVDIQSACDAQVDALQDETARQAKVDGDKLDENLRRLQALENRKNLLQIKRGLLDEAFSSALSLLRGLPKEEMRRLMLEQTVQAAQGDEQVAAGSINDDFYGPDFIAEANRLLTAAGKPGLLRDAGHKHEGVCGLVLQSPGTQTFCTMEMLLQEKRTGLEPEVAQLLSAGLS